MMNLKKTLHNPCIESMVTSYWKYGNNIFFLSLRSYGAIWKKTAAQFCYYYRFIIIPSETRSINRISVCLYRMPIVRDCIKRMRTDDENRETKLLYVCSTLDMFHYMFAIDGNMIKPSSLWNTKDDNRFFIFFSCFRFEN